MPLTVVSDVNVRSLVVSMVKQCAALTPEARRDLSITWKKRAETSKRNAEYFQKQAQFSSEKLSDHMALVYDSTADLLVAQLDGDPDIAELYPELI